MDEWMDGCMGVWINGSGAWSEGGINNEERRMGERRDGEMND